MVLSASSVFSYRATGDSYTIVRRQLHLGGRRPAGRVRRQPGLAAVGAPPGLPGVLGLAGPAAAHRLLRRRAQRQHQLAGARPAARSSPPRSPSCRWSIWAAHIYANKERRLGSLHQIMVPVVPGMLLATGLVIVGRDLGTALVLFAILIGMLWVVGAPARLFLRLDRWSSASSPWPWPPPTPSGWRASPPSSTRSRTSTAPAGSPPTASTPCRPAACSARASAPASRSGARCPRPTPTSSSPCSARSSAWSAPCW